MTEPEFVPVTSKTWPDFETLFEQPGSPKFCRCTNWRDLPGRQSADSAAKKKAMAATVAAGTPVGIIASSGSGVVGWCSVAPRGTFRKLSPDQNDARPAAIAASAPHCSTQPSITPSGAARPPSRPIRSIRSRQVSVSWASGRCSPREAFARPAWPVLDEM